MGWLSIVCAAIAAWLLYTSHSTWLFWLTVAAGVGALWSYGVMHNYAMEAAKRRPGFSGKFYDITEREAGIVPNWLSATNMISSILCFLLLVGAIAIRVIG